MIGKTEDLTTEKDWENVVSQPNVEDIPFKDIFHKYLSKTRGTALEIGCVPGQFLAYICRKFGYFPEGIDYVKNTKKTTAETLRNNSLNNFKIHKADFRKWKPSKKYDLVCSFGFIEHFSNPLKITEKHIALIKNGGKLFIEVPNFSGFKGWLQKTFDTENYKKHNTQVMNLEFYENIAKENNLKIIYLGYYGGFKIWWVNKHPTLYQKLVHHSFKLISLATENLKMNNRLSPFIVFIAEKPIQK
jgi:SAM-dependent methyltransferase